MSSTTAVVSPMGPRQVTFGAKVDGHPRSHCTCTAPLPDASTNSIADVATMPTMIPAAMVITSRPG
jgi:hypothetical protein